MKKSKKLIASFLALLMLMAVMMAPAAMALREIIVRPPGLNVTPVIDGTERATHVWQPVTAARRYVHAEVYAERANGSALWAISARSTGSAATRPINISGMVIVQHSGWFA